MGYSIIFETKIVKLPDGRIIHFDRSGCNNDNEGRKKDEFTAKIYDESGFINYAEGFKKNSKPYKESGGWDLKIGSRYAAYYDYGEHLLRMLRRAKSYEDFIKDNYFSARLFVGIELLTPEFERIITDPQEIDEIFYNSIYGNQGISYRRIIEYPTDITEIVSLIEDNKPVNFYISKR